MRNGAIALACAVLLAFAADPLISGAAQTGTAKGGAAAGAAVQAAGEPAAWITRDVELNLKDLPKTYSCDDLWYKLRGILLAIGAREYMAITPYSCGHGAANDGRSPTLELKFQTLRALSAAQARWADTEAVTRIVRLGPGEPKILDSGDCALLEQVEDTVFSYLDMPVVEKNFDCSAPSGSSPRGATRFALSVRVLMQKSGHSSST